MPTVSAILHSALLIVFSTCQTHPEPCVVCLSASRHRAGEEVWKVERSTNKIYIAYNSEQEKLAKPWSVLHPMFRSSSFIFKTMRNIQTLLNKGVFWKDYSAFHIDRQVRQDETGRAVSKLLWLSGKRLWWWTRKAIEMEKRDWICDWSVWKRLLR